MKGTKPTPRELLNAAPKHPAYKDACRHAARQAYDRREEGRAENYYNPPCFAVYFDGDKMYVRATTEKQPDDSVIVCIAQHWNTNSVQLRFMSATSTWMDFWHQSPSDPYGEIDGKIEKLA